MPSKEPVVISLSMSEQQALEENIQVFERLGYCIESFGGNEYILNGVPAQLPDIATQELFIEIIDGLVITTGGFTICVRGLFCSTCFINLS